MLGQPSKIVFKLRAALQTDANSIHQRSLQPSRSIWRKLWRGLRFRLHPDLDGHDCAAPSPESLPRRRPLIRYRAYILAVSMMTGGTTKASMLPRMEKPIWKPAIDPIKDSDPVAELLAHRLILDTVKTGDTALACANSPSTASRG